MMIHKVCAVYDFKMEAYLRPFFVPTTGMAARSFGDEVNRAAADNGMYAHPEDYCLFHLCDFDESTGMFFGGEKGALKIVAAADIKKERDNG